MRSILTTLNFPDRPAWTRRARVLDRSEMSLPRLLRELPQRARPEDVVVLDGGIGASDAYVDRVAAALLARKQEPPAVLITDSTWTPGRGRRAALRALDGPRTAYCVLSSSEQRSFPETWGVDPSRVFFTPFYWTLPEDEPEAHFGGAGVFAGGDSLRDHATLVAAAAEVDVPVTVATRRSRPAALPPNVAWGPLPADRYTAELRACAVAVVPMLPGLVRSAGQQTYLNAMVLGKAVVVSDVPGVRDHVVDGETGLIVPAGDSGALADALRWLHDPANAADVQRMRRRAREVALATASPDRYVERILEVVDALAA
jgi:hypothetical protein